MAEPKKLVLSMSLQQSKPLKKKQLKPTLGLVTTDEKKIPETVDYITTISDKDTSMSISEPPKMIIPLTTNHWEDDVSKEEKDAVEAILNDIEQIDSSTLKNSSNKTIKPILQSNMIPGLMNIDNEDDRFKHDVSLRAQNINVKSECYIETPISDFGEALLRGMGWEGKISDEKESQRMARPSRLGLGARTKPPSPTSSKNKKNKSKNNKKIEQSKEAWKKEAEKKLKNQSLLVGSIVWLKDIRFIKNNNIKRAKILRLTGVPGLNQIEVMLEGSEGEVTCVNRSDAILIELSELEKMPFIEKEQKLEIHEKKRNDLKNENNKRTLSSKDHKNKNHYEKDNDDDDNRYEKKKKKLHTWVFIGCKVRIVEDGKYHRMKGDVIHMDGDYFKIQLENGKILKDMKEKYLESVIPSIGDHVFIVRGSYCEQKGKIIEKNRDKEQVTVELLTSHQRHSFSFDDVTAIATSSKP